MKSVKKFNNLTLSDNMFIPLNHHHKIAKDEPGPLERLRQLEEKIEKLNGSIKKDMAAALKTEIESLRQQIQQTSRNSTFHLHLLSTLDEGFCFVNPEGVIEFVNEQFCQLLGYSQQEVIGTRAQDMIAKEGHSNTIAQKLELRKKGYSDTYEIPISHKNGNEIWMRIKAKPVYSESGEFLGSMSLLYDISEELNTRKKLQRTKDELEMRVLSRTAELRESNHRLKQEIRQKKMAQIELQKSQKRISELFNFSPDAIFVENLNGDILSVNEAAVKLHGYSSPEEMIGRNVFDTIPNNFRQQALDNFKTILTEKVQHFESFRRTKDGKDIPVDISARLIDYNNQPAVLLHVRDISERKAAEEVLKNAYVQLEERVKNRTKDLENLNRQLKIEIEDRKRFESALQTQESFLRTIIDTDPNMIFVKDSAGRFVMVNQAVADVYNTSVEELVGKDNAYFNQRDDELNSFHEQDQRVFQTGEPAIIPEDKVTNLKTGETRFFQTIKVPISFNGEREGTHILGVSTDITDVIKAREEASGHRDLYREISRNIPDSAVYLLDKEMRYLLAEGSDNSYFGNFKESLEGKTMHEVLDEGTISWLEPVFQKTITGDQAEFEFKHKDKHFKLSSLPIFGSDGTVTYCMMLVTDITALKESQQTLERRAAQLARSNEDLEKFAYVASHDLQEPLRSVASYVQLLGSRYQGQLDEQANEFISFTVDGVKRMQALIQDLLSYSRLSFKDVPFQETDLNTIVKGVIMNLEESINQKKAKVTVGQLPRLEADSSQLIQLFQNLIENAVKFCRDNNPEIEIKAEELENHWMISVKDNGIGISEKFAERIFVIFQRLHSRSEYDGTGIGLAICKKIVERHHGKIWLESTEGVGTTFFFTLSKEVEVNY